MKGPDLWASGHTDCSCSSNTGPLWTHGASCRYDGNIVCVLVCVCVCVCVDITFATDECQVVQV